MKPRCSSIIVYLAIFSCSALHAQEKTCTGPSELPPAGGVGTPYCHNGRMGYAVTEFATISQATNMPYVRAVEFATRKAQLKARVALARFLSDSSLYGTTTLDEKSIDSSDRQEWNEFFQDTNGEAFRARLESGISIIASETREGAVYITAATTPDLSEISESVNRRDSAK